MGSAFGAPMAIGHTRMHSKHWARRPPVPTLILYQAMELSRSVRIASRSPASSAAMAWSSMRGSASYCSDISAQAAMS